MDVHKIIRRTYVVSDYLYGATTMGKKNFSKWSTRDLLITAVMSLVLAFLSIFLTFFSTIVVMPLGVIPVLAVHELLSIPALLVAYIIRRPGTAILSQTIIAVVSIGFNTWGWLNLAVIVTRGIPLELPFLITKYRKYNLTVLISSITLTGVVSYLALWIPLKIYLLNLNFIILGAIVTIVTSIIYGVFTKVIADSIAKTGVLSNYAIGQNTDEEI